MLDNSNRMLVLVMMLFVMMKFKPQMTRTKIRIFICVIRGVTCHRVF